MADTDIDFDLLVKAGGPVRHFKAGDIIFREGDPPAELFVGKSGTVEIRIGGRRHCAHGVCECTLSTRNLSVGGRPWLSAGHLLLFLSLVRTVKRYITWSKARPGLRPSTKTWRAARVARLSLVAKGASF